MIHLIVGPLSSEVLMVMKANIEDFLVNLPMP